ncbi:MAG: hypothetical protein JWQ35_2783 [Bacteriovoracaceae bacterium]|nr:hypothetical protein [Bacteriovoracaceae bacterium]
MVDIAQLVEHPIVIRMVTGSNPVIHPSSALDIFPCGRFAPQTSSFSPPTRSVNVDLTTSLSLGCRRPRHRKKSEDGFPVFFGYDEEPVLHENFLRLHFIYFIYLLRRGSSLLGARSIGRLIVSISVIRTAQTFIG